MTTSEHLSSYPSIYAIGHSGISQIFEGEVLIEEKIDGSQFSFGLIDGQFVCRSKNCDIIPSSPDKMFSVAVETASKLDLKEGWIYRCEYLQSPKHNTLKYDRVPNKHLIIFDICTGVETYLNAKEKAEEAARIGLECVPAIFQGKVENFDHFNTFLERDSILGGCKIEGVVVKNYSVFTKSKKISIGKYVSEAFKESHTKEWKNSNPSSMDVIKLIIETYKTEARWRKAIQHLRDDGKLEGSPKDIGFLIGEVKADIFKEHKEEIKDRLFAHFKSSIERGVIAGLPEFYKQELLQSVLK